MKIGKVFTFEAAHDLPNHDGKCRGLHGHSYRVEVELEGDTYPDDGRSDGGMVEDYANVKEVWSWFHTELDHKYLNDVLPVVTTAENIAQWILDRFRNVWVSDNSTIVSVTVWETATSWARAE